MLMHATRLATLVVMAGFAAMATPSLANSPVPVDERSYYKTDVDLFSQLPVQRGDYVIIGDSLVERGRWHEMLVGPKMIRNRGIDGDTIPALTRRMGAILDGQPAIIVFQIGNNDFMRGANNAEILRRYGQLLTLASARSPQTKLVVTGLPPKRRHGANAVKYLNDGLQQLALKHDAIYVDLFAPFADRSGALARDLTHDFLHLNGKGYKLFAQLIAPHLPGLAAID